MARHPNVVSPMNPMATAVKTHPGYRAVSARPGSRDGMPLAKIVLTNGKEWQTVYESLKGGDR